MRRHFFALAVLAFLSHAGLTQADLAWDGFAEVPAVSILNGAYLTCPPGAHFVHDKGSGIQADTAWCYTGSVFYERAGRPVEVSLQSLLDMHVKPPSGTAFVAQGPLPVYGRAGRNPFQLLVAYKVVKNR